MTAPLTITVHGTPAGQGQVSFLGVGRPAVHTNRKFLLPWRRAVIAAAIAAAGTHEYVGPKGTKACLSCGVARKLHGLLAGPVGVQITVTVEQSKASAKRGDRWPDNNTTTDIDHHARAELDAITAASVVRDDGQVAHLTVDKVFPGSDHPHALDQPGAVIRIWQLDGAEVTR